MRPSTGRAEEENMGTSRGQGEAVAGTAAARWTSRFDEGHAGMRDRLGGKGAGLAEMSRLGLPVPPGFTVTTDACREYLARGRQFPPGLLDEARARVRE